MRSRRRRRVSQETPASAAPPARNRRGRRPAAQSQARPTRTHPHPAPPPGCSRGPVPARSPGRTALPSRRPRRAPQPPAAAPTPRWALRARAPAPRRPGAVSDPPPANAALNLRNNKQPDMSESAAAGPPSLAAKPQARPDRGGNGAPPGQLVPGPARPTRTPEGHTHNTTCTAPSGGPGPGHTFKPWSRRGPHSQHSWTRSQLARTHSHPLQTRSYTRIPGTLGIHWDPRSPRRSTPPAPDTRTHRAHGAGTHSFRTRSHAFTHVHGSHKHTHRTHVLCSPRGQNPQSTLCHTQNKNTQAILGHTTNNTPG